MKIFTGKNLIQKTIISLIILCLLFSIIPIRTYAATDWSLAGNLLKELTQLVANLADVVMSALNNFMLGTDGFNTSMLDIDVAKHNAENVEGSSLNPDGIENPTVITIPNSEIDAEGIFGDGRRIPNMLYSPENIFSNNVGMLDVNFLHPNTYTSSVSGESVEYNEDEEITDQDHQISAAAVVGPTIASWYNAFRNISIVGLLTVLVYLGIKILISSTASDKAKYKQSLQDWFMALCLVFVIHIIMSGILILIDQVNYLFDDSANNIVVDFQGDGDYGIKFRTNLIGLVRFRAQSSQWQQAVAYCLVYVVLVIYTIIFTFQYLKRFLYMAFFTMIAPLVALTYPIDKAGDGKAQAFNMWFKEYTVNAMIQPIHLLLYTALVSSAISLAASNPIYAIVAIGFMIPAEKFIKKMFRIESETSSAIGSFAGGALAMTGLQKLASLGPGKKASTKGSSGSGDSGDDNDSSKIAFAKTSNDNTFGSFAGGILPGANPNGGDNQGGNEPVEPVDDTHRRLLEDRAEYERMANDQNASELDRQEAQEQVNIINEDMRNRGYLPSQESEQHVRTEQGGTDQEQPQTLDQTIRTNNPVTDEQRPNRGWRRRYLKARVKNAAPTVLKAAKGTARMAAKVGVGAVGATIGLASGISQGDPSKAFTNMAVGAVAGGTIGSNAYNVAESAGRAILDMPGKFERRDNEIKYMRDEAKYGAAVARERRIERENAVATANFLSSSTEQKKWDDVRAKMARDGYRGNTEDLMKVVADYKRAGVDDDKMIENALKLETKYGDGQVGGTAHENVLDVARFTAKNGYGREYVEDEKKRKSLDAHIDAKVSNESVRKQIKKMHAELNDVGHLRQ